MATKRKSPVSNKKQTVRAVETLMVSEVEKVGDGEKIDQQEEKVLDWILKGVVAFVLGWLALSVMMVLGGYFHLWG